MAEPVDTPAVRNKILAIGEVLWDVFPDGPRFGGAPANYACHAAACGAEVSLVSRVGHDGLGDAAVDFLGRHGVNTQEVQRDEQHPTGTVNVELDAHGSPRFRFADDTAWDFLQWTPALEGLASRIDAVCFGTLGQRSPASRSTIRRLLAAVSPDVLRLLDVNLRSPFFDATRINESLTWANALKLNEEELPIVSEAVGITGALEQRIDALRVQYGLSWVVVTRGAHGSVLRTDEGWSYREGQSVAVVDTVGAGDAFAAVLTLAMLRRMPTELAHGWAAEVAAYVCSQAGAVPELPDTLREVPREQRESPNE